MCLSLFFFFLNIWIHKKKIPLTNKFNPENQGKMGHIIHVYLKLQIFHKRGGMRRQFEKSESYF